MTYKNLLVHLDDSKACDSRLSVAMELARTFEAHLAGLYVALDPLLPGNLRAEVPQRFLASLADQANERARAASARFTETMRKNGLNPDVRTAHASVTNSADIVTLHARYADLVILGQPEQNGGGEGDVSLAETVVLSSGRPGLVVPYIGSGRRLGRRIMLAWDGGREAARAANDALPLLKGADKVTVLVVSPHKGTHGAEPGADIALHLARHAVNTETHHIEAGDLDVANSILARLADLDIDLLVMGAYGHSRLREWILGGATRDIFRHMTVPVLMSH